MESPNLARGIQLLEIGRIKEAIPFLQKALQDDFHNWNTKYYLALAYYNTNDYNNAEKLSNTLLEEEPNNPAVFFLKSKIELQKDNLNKAIEHIDIAISIQPYDSDFFAQKSLIYLHKKDYINGLDNANHGLSIDAKNSICLNLRAQFLTKLNRVEEADNTIENILHDNPEDEHSHANVGWVELEKGNHKKSMTHFKEALKLNPNFEYARNGMSTAIKAKNILYKAFLKYAFWMGNKSTKIQWIYILGIYFAYRFSIKVLSEAGMTYMVIPLVIAYLLFALGGWIMEPLSNMILLMDNYGKYLLNKVEKQSGIAFSILFFIALLSGILFLIIPNRYFLLITITSLCSLLPLPRAFLQNSKKAKLFGVCYGALMILIGLFGPLFNISIYSTGFIIFILMMAFTWVGNLFK